MSVVIYLFLFYLEKVLHKVAKEYFDQLGVQKLPTIKELNEQYAELLAEKKIHPTTILLEPRCRNM